MPCHIRRIGFATPVIRLDVRGTCSANRIRRDKRKVRRARRRARIGAADRTVTGLAGVVAVDELIDRLGVVAALAEDFHIYSADWTEDRVTFAIDGEVTGVVRMNDVPADGTWPFTGPQYLLLNVAVGGRLPGPPGRVDATRGIHGR